MQTITSKDVRIAIDNKAVVTLASSTESGQETKRLEYDFQFKAFTIHTENGTITTDKVTEAVHRYNTGDMTLQKYNEA
jgi:hypothetical protein